mmetsp:Transcript_25699/g.78108  ORF Transcript_25699/g.78108 Transcript_25699/m.78108 type:complete len:208 (+) Transcript_25699:926-1549(+)
MKWRRDAMALRRRLISVVNWVRNTCGPFRRPAFDRCVGASCSSSLRVLHSPRILAAATLAALRSEARSPLLTRGLPCAPGFKPPWLAALDAALAPSSRGSGVSDRGGLPRGFPFGRSGGLDASSTLAPSSTASSLAGANILSEQSTDAAGTTQPNISDKLRELATHALDPRERRCLSRSACLRASTPTPRNTSTTSGQTTTSSSISQ